jgi:hypothetical protein
MRSRFVIGMVLVSLTVAAGCEDDFDSAAEVTTADPTGASSTDGPTELIGSWHRAQTCAEMLAAFQAGVADSHIEWLQGKLLRG